MGFNITERVGRSTYYIIRTKQAAGLTYRHIVLTKVNTIGTKFANQQHAIVDYKRGTRLTT